MDAMTSAERVPINTGDKLLKPCGVSQLVPSLPCPDAGTAYVLWQ